MKKLITLLLLLHSFAFCESKLVIVRHGQGTHNIQHVWNSDPEHPNYVPAPLTDLGKEQIRSTAKALLEQGINESNVALVLVSPLLRTKETANILAEEGVISAEMIELDVRLREPLMGDLENKGSLRVEGKDNWDLWFAEEFHGETLEQVKNRTQDLFSELLEKKIAGHILLVTHGTVARELIDLSIQERPKLGVGEAKVVPLPEVTP